MGVDVIGPFAYCGLGSQGMFDLIPAMVCTHRRNTETFNCDGLWVFRNQKSTKLYPLVTTKWSCMRLPTSPCFLSQHSIGCPIHYWFLPTLPFFLGRMERSAKQCESYSGPKRLWL